MLTTDCRESFSEELKQGLRTAVDQAMGPKEDITLDPPVCQADGTWTGGLAIERGAKPVKANTRCYTLANSYQAPKSTWSPAVNAKINGSFDKKNIMTHDVIMVRCSALFAMYTFILSYHYR